jgi:ABC-2 type transport system ATP-binding protein
MSTKSSTEAIIEVKEVSKRYGRTLALDGVSLEVGGGELFALLGPNGAGKTTLVHILCTIHQPDGGTARVAGFDVVRQPLRARQRIGVVFQEPSLDDRLTAFENLDFHGRIYGVPGAVRRKRIKEMLELVELADRREHLVRSFSSGMKRRLEIARSLVHDSRLLFLDEPTAGLDAQTRGRIWDYIGALLRERELTVLVTTHYIEEVEKCDRVCIIDHGKVLAKGTPAELKAAHGQELLRVQPRDEATRDELIARYGERLSQRNGEVLISSDGEAFVETFLRSYGTRIRAMTVEKPSLETVFLSLTGREIRDQEMGARERLYTFGKRGGEHTR